jgi:hypothetical protein
MTCICAKSLANLLLSLVPAFKLALPAVKVPPLLEDLSAILPGMASASLVSRTSLSAVARMRFAPFPLSPAALANIQGAASAYLQLRALGINPESRSASTQISALIASININLGGLGPVIPSATLARLLAVGRICAILVAARTTLGIDLLIPNVAVQLRTALAARLEAMEGPMPALSPQALANLSAYAALATSSAPFGGLGGLIPALRIMLSLRIPSLRISLPGLADLLAAMAALANVRAALGIDPFALNGMALIRARLALFLPLHAISLGMGQGLSSGVHLQMILPNLPALPGVRIALAANTRLLMGLPVRNFAPINLAAALASQTGLASHSRCDSRCPVGALVA